jgi:hypothetical protein
VLNTPTIVLAALMVVVAANTLLFFGHYRPRTSPTPTSDPVLVGAGDIADCSSSGDEATAKVLGGISGTIYTTGDNAYESGKATEFSNCYATPAGAAIKPALGRAWATTSTKRQAPPATSATLELPRGTRPRATTTPTTSESGT